MSLVVQMVQRIFLLEIWPTVGLNQIQMLSAEHSGCSKISQCFHGPLFLKQVLHYDVTTSVVLEMS
jgi:hypothetical protein